MKSVHQKKKNQEPNQPPEENNYVRSKRLIGTGTTSSKQPVLKEEFWAKYWDRITASTFIGSMAGVAIGGTIGGLIGVGLIPFFGIGLPATPVLIGIVGAIGAGVGGAIGFTKEVIHCIIDDKREIQLNHSDDIIQATRNNHKLNDKTEKKHSIPVIAPVETKRSKPTSSFSFSFGDHDTLYHHENHKTPATKVIGKPETNKKEIIHQGKKTFFKHE